MKSDVAFLYRVIATIRDWKEFCVSFSQVSATENEYFIKKIQNLALPDFGLSAEEFIAFKTDPIHPALQWWENNFGLILNAKTRGFPFYCIAYDQLLEQPHNIIPMVLKWCINPLPNDILSLEMRGHHPKTKELISNLNIEKAIEIVRPDQKRQHKGNISNIDFPFADKVRDTFDEFYDCFNNKKQVISSSFASKLNECHLVLEPFIKQQRIEHRDRVLHIMKEHNISSEDYEKILASKRVDG